MSNNNRNDIVIRLPEAIKVPAPNRGAGRPRKESIEVLRAELDKHKDHYLTVFYEKRLRRLEETVPLECKDECPYGKECKGEKTCPVEKEDFIDYFYGYLSELGIDASAPTEVVAASELATMDILEGRCLSVLSKDGVVAPTLVALTSSDSAIYETTGHPVVKILESIQKRRTAVLNQLAATREQKVKLAAEMAKKKSPAELMSLLLSRSKERQPMEEDSITVEAKEV